MKADKYQNTTDQELLEQFYADHDNEWLGILLQRYTLLLLGVSMKYLKNEEEAKDSVQQIFLKVIQELQKYKVEYFKSWLYMVAKNHCLMKLREKQGKITAEITERLSIKPEDETDLQALVDNDHTLELMELALKELNAPASSCVENGCRNVSLNNNCVTAIITRLGQRINLKKAAINFMKNL